MKKYTNYDAIKVIKKEFFSLDDKNSELGCAYLYAIDALEKHSSATITKYNVCGEWMVHVYLSLDEIFNITSDDIINMLSDEDKEKFNKCVIKKVIKTDTDDNVIEMYCQVFKED